MTIFSLEGRSIHAIELDLTHQFTFSIALYLTVYTETQTWSLDRSNSSRRL